jgi:hypothetical protein
VSELLGAHAARPERVALLGLRIELEAVAVGVLDLEQVGDPGLGVRAPLGLDPGRLKVALGFVERPVDPEREVVEPGLCAPLDGDGVVDELRRQVCSAVVALGELEVEDVGVVGGEPVDIG